MLLLSHRRVAMCCCSAPAISGHLKWVTAWRQAAGAWPRRGGI